MERLPIISLEIFRPARASWKRPVPLDGERKEDPSEGAATTAIEPDKRNPAPAITPVELDDGVYESEVLQLKNGQTEESLDEGHAREALELAMSIDHRGMLSCDSSASDSITTVTTGHLRSESASKGSQSTGFTSHSSTGDYAPAGITTFKPQSRFRSRRMTLRMPLSFTKYERFLDEAQAQELSPAGGSCPPIPPTSLAPSVYPASSKKSLFSPRRSLRRLSGFREFQSTGATVKSCVCCCDEFTMAKSLQTLPCSHTYCKPCLRILIIQAMEDESKMPSKCCSQPIPGSFIKNVLSRDEQSKFINAVLQYSIPWKDRIFCPNPDCGEFVPKAARVDPKQPFQVTCRKCRTRICKTCKGVAHPHDQDCPADWELDAVLHLGENQGWKRCYKCRNLVELTHGCTHMTCRCKAQFCYICGAAWDPSLGCPSSCDGEAELERRRIQAEERREREEEENAKREAAEQAKVFEAFEAARRSAQNEQLVALRKLQVVERDAFMAFEQKQRWAMWTRHAQEKIELLDQHATAEKNMKDRHLNTATALEDRQVSAELELRQTFEQERKACIIRLRHMEAYCDALNNANSPPETINPLFPTRTITPTHFQELTQQYNLRDNLDRTHQSRINVLRGKQAQQLEALVQRQEDESAKLRVRLRRELELLEQRFAEVEGIFDVVFKARRERMVRRWGVMEEIERRRLEGREKLPFGPLPVLLWPDEANGSSSPKPSVLLGQQA